MYYKLASLTLNSGEAPDLASDIFIAQPDANKEILAGRLFVLAEIRGRKHEALKIINFLINNIHHNYYQNEKIILRERISTLRVEHIFEAALAKTNRELAEFLAGEKMKIDISNFNVTIGIIYENDLHFSNVGKNKVLLVYKERRATAAEPRAKNQNQGENGYKIVDIGKNDFSEENVSAARKSERSATKSVKFFSGIISGQIPRGGYCMFSNETLAEYLSGKQMLKIITKLPPRGAVEQIRNMLVNIKLRVPFLAVIIKNTVGMGPVSRGQEPAGDIIISGDDQTNGLNRVEEETEKLLAPYGIINFKKWFKFFLSRFPKSKAAHSQAGKKIFLTPGGIILRRKHYFEKTLRILKNLLFYLLSLFLCFFRIFSSKDNFIGFLKKIKSLWLELINGVKRFCSWLKNLNRKSRILFILAIIFLVLFIAGLFYTGFRNKSIEEQQARDDLIATIEKKENQVDAHLLYSNEEGAKAILDELKALFNQLPAGNEDDAAAYEQYRQKYESQLEKIRHVVRIDNYDELADFTNLNSQANAKNIVLVADKIYAGDGGQKAIYILGLPDQTVTAIADLNQPVNTLEYPAPDNNKNIYYFNLDSLIRLDTESDDISGLSLSLPTGGYNIVAAASYNNRLYFLDKAGNQLYRYIGGPDGFGQRDNWLQESADFSRAVNFSIDGHIYILNSDGRVLKYLRGQLQDFTLETIEPEFSNPTKIMVSPELEFIYILEPAAKRLAVFDKTGDFLMQYLLEDFTDLKDFVVDEAAKKIYFLNGNSVYQVEATHFQD